MAEAQSTPRREAPKYKLTEKAYLNERLYDPELMPIDHLAEPLEDGTQPRKDLVVTFDGIPGYYMVPVNGAAKAMCEKHADRMHAVDPIRDLTIVTPEPAKA